MAWIWTAASLLHRLCLLSPLHSHSLDLCTDFNRFPIVPPGVGGGGEGWRGIILWILLFTHRILHPVLSPGTSSADTAASTGATLGLQVEIPHHTYIFCRLMSSLYSCTNCTILVLYLRNHEQKKVDMCNVEESSSFRVL